MSREPFPVLHPDCAKAAERGDGARRRLLAGALAKALAIVLAVQPMVVMSQPVPYRPLTMPGAPQPGASSTLPASSAPEREGPFRSVLPDLGDRSSEDLSLSGERRLGEEIMSQIRSMGGELDDPETREYLNQLGATLAAGAPPGTGSFEFFGVRDPAINAFALPGGYIGVHTGLVVTAQSESELASVLAHEIGHVTQRHIARSIGKQREASLIAMGAMVLAILAARAGNDQVTQAAAATGTGLAAHTQLNFSREAEREADRVGFQIMQSTGFDVNGMVDIFGRLQQASRFYESAAPAYVLTHPLTGERIADIRNRLGDVRYRQRQDSPEFQLMRVRLRILQNDARSALIDTRRVLEEQLRSGPSNQRAATRYGLTLVALRLREVDVAQREAAELRKLLSKPVAMAEKLQVEVRLAAKDFAGALEVARLARTAFPQSRLLAMSYTDALQQAGQHDEALTFLRDQLTLYRNEPLLHEMIARSHAAQKQPFQEHRALAESAALRGNFRGAVEQLLMARRVGSADFFEMSQVDARLRDLQARVLEREKEERQAKPTGR